MMSIKLIKNGKIYVAIIELADLQEVMDNFDGIATENGFILENKDNVINELYKLNLLDRGEKIAYENCDYLAFENNDIAGVVREYDNIIEDNEKKIVRDTKDDTSKSTVRRCR